MIVLEINDSYIVKVTVKGSWWGGNAAEEKNKSDKILVAEDDEVSNPIIFGLLNQKGVSKISQPKNGNVALSKLYLNQASIIMSGGRMPDMDGLGFHRRAEKGRSA